MEKMKLDNIGVEGKATVELKNSRGKTIEKVEGKNFIGQNILTLALPSIQRYYFGQTMVNSRDIFHFSVFNNDNLLITPNTLMYTNNSLPEAPLTESLVSGTISGFSNKSGGTSPNVMQGIVNTAESLHTLSRTRWVMDWATDKGNGICRSIYWTRDRIPTFLAEPLHLQSVTPQIILNPSPIMYSVLGTDGTNIFIGDSNTSALRVDRLLNNTVINTTEPTSFMWTSMSWFTVVGNLLYSSNADSTGYRFFSTPIGNVGGSTLITTSFIGSHIAPPITSIGNIVYIVLSSGQSTGTTTIRRFNTTTSQFMPDLVTSTPPTTFGGNVCFAVGNDTIRVGMENTNFRDVNINTGVITDTTIPCAAGSYTRIGSNTFHIENTAHISNGIYSLVHNFNRCNMYSRILLPADIVKTSANTLKITYDFNYA